VETRWPTPGEGIITTSAFFILDMHLLGVNDCFFYCSL